MRTCLFSVVEHDLRSRLRGGDSDEAIGEYLQSVVVAERGAASHRRAGICRAGTIHELHRRLTKRRATAAHYNNSADERLRLLVADAEFAEGERAALSSTGSSSSSDGKSVRFQNRPMGISSPH